MAQLKSRLLFSKKYEGKGIYMTFKLPATGESTFTHMTR